MKSAALAAISLVLLAAPDAHADDAKQACVTAHAEAQTLRTESKLREAREKLLVCGRPECPAAVRSDCAKWLGEVQDEIPSIMVAATDANGGDVADVRVVVDGSVVAKELTGQPIMLNPGSRTLRFEREGASPVERKLVLRVGERNRRVEVSFSPKLAGAGPAAPNGNGGDTPAGPAPEPDAAPSKGGGIPAATFVLGGVGVLGLAGFTFFALDGKKKEDDLKQCKPNCASDDVQSARTSYLLGDVSLGVGVLALAGAAYFYFAQSPKQEAATRAPLWLDVRPSARGATGVVGGHF